MELNMKSIVLILVFSTMLQSISCRSEPRKKKQSPFKELVDKSMLEESKIEFMSGDNKLEGHAAYSKSFPGEKPVVVILPPEGSLDDFSIWIAQRLAGLGYIGFAVDLSGENAPGSLEDNPEEWVTRSRAAVDAVSAIGDMAKLDSIAVIGTSQGATVALELALTGIKVAGIGSVHPSSLQSLGSPPAEDSFEGRLAVFVGDLQTGFTSEDVFKLQTDLKEKDVTYEVTRISKADDNFMIPTKKSLESEPIERRLASSRIWDSLTGFLDDVFNPENAEYLDDPWEITMINDTMLTTATVSYEEGSTKLEGFVAYDKTITGPRPIVIIIPDWDGLDAYEMWRAKLLAMMGYVGFAADMFGADVERGASLPIERRIELTSSLLGGDGEAGLARMRAAFEAVTTDESLADIVDVENIAAIGYCFGGSSVMEFLRVAPEGLKGIVSYHGGKLDAGEAGEAGECTGVAALIHNGDDDGSITDEEIDAFKTEFNKASINWEFVDYGATVHSFTDPESPRNGTRAAYNPLADSRSWHSTGTFFKRIFAGDGQYVACPAE